MNDQVTVWQNRFLITLVQYNQILKVFYLNLGVKILFSVVFWDFKF